MNAIHHFKHNRGSIHGHSNSTPVPYHLRAGNKPTALTLGFGVGHWVLDVGCWLLAVAGCTNTLQHRFYIAVHAIQNACIICSPSSCSLLSYRTVPPVCIRMHAFIRLFGCCLYIIIGPSLLLH